MTESDAPSGVLDTRNIVICLVLAAILFISHHPQDIERLTSSLRQDRLARPLIPFQRSRPSPAVIRYTHPAEWDCTNINLECFVFVF